MFTEMQDWVNSITGPVLPDTNLSLNSRSSSVVPFHRTYLIDLNGSPKQHTPSPVSHFGTPPGVYSEMVTILYLTVFPSVRVQLTGTQNCVLLNTKMAKFKFQFQARKSGAHTPSFPSYYVRNTGRVELVPYKTHLGQSR